MSRSGRASGPSLPFSAGVWVLLVDQALMNAGFFMLFPLLGVHLTRTLGFDVATVGLVFALRQIVQQGAAPLGGALSDRVGYKPVLVAGFAVRTVGFLLFATSSSLPAILAGAMVTALGGALFDPPSRAALAWLTPERQRQDVYAAAGTAGWIGQVVGPLLGAWLLPFDFVWVTLASATAFLLASVQAALFLPGGMRGEPSSVTFLGSIGLPLRDRDFMAFVVLLMGYWFVAVQGVITVPLLADRLAGAGAIGVIFAIQAGVAVLLQVPLSRWAARHLRPLQQLFLAMLLIGLGFGGYAVSAGFAALAAATVVVALGHLLVMPVQATVTARLAGGQAGAYFGVGNLALGVGGALGNGLGGVLVDLGDRSGVAWLPWTAMALVAVVSGLGCLLLGRREQLQARLAGHGWSSPTSSTR